MRVVNWFPPNVDAIDARFNFRARGFKPLFAWGDVIYNPYAINIPVQIFAHEKMHSLRQEVDGVERWWYRYINDDEFRLMEEVLGHRAEYESLLAQAGSSRLNRRRFMTDTVQRLRSPLYQYKVTAEMAKRLLKGVGQHR